MGPDGVYLYSLKCGRHQEDICDRYLPRRSEYCLNKLFTGAICQSRYLNNDLSWNDARLNIVIIYCLRYTLMFMVNL